MEQAGIDSALMARIRERLAVDWRRTGDGDFLRMPKELRQRHAPSGPMGMLWRSINDRAAADAQEKALRPIEPLAPKAVENVEKSLGIALPGQLRQLYLEIGDGGFGPYSGIRRLSNWAKDYAKLRAELPAERGRDWPEGLLPIVYCNGKRICVDARSGAVLLWTKPPKKASEKKWLASFVPQSPSIAAWLERWVDTPTQAEDGPEGGWAPPAEEVARRDAVEQEKEAKREAEAEKARTVTPADLPPLPEQLLERVRARATDPARRTYLAATASGSTPIGLEDIEDGLVGAAQHIPEHAIHQLSGLLAGLRRFAPLPGLSMARTAGGGMVMMKPGSGGKLGQPATEAALANAEKRIGFVLPEPLRQLYRIADGGFGPGDTGFLSLARMIERYVALKAKPQGPSGELWPARLLPIWSCDEEIGCLDVETGAITTYDPSRMADIHGGYWRRSFATEHGSLAELLETWLGGRTFEEEAQPGGGSREPVPGEESAAEIAIAWFAGRSPEERAAAGLPEVGWENELRRRHGG